jgi:hypothetical protein
MTIKDELVDLQKRDGILRPEVAVAWAHEHPKSALYASLEWDDTAAAQQYRIWQVRHLIAVHVVNKEGVRQIVSLSIDRTNDGGYRDIHAVLASPPMRAVLLADALAELDRVRLKYDGLVELARVWEEARKVKIKQAKRSKAKGRAAKSGSARQAKRSGAKLHHERSRPAMQA